MTMPLDPTPDAMAYMGGPAALPPADSAGGY
jgi:hypothetical protein